MSAPRYRAPWPKHEPNGRDKRQYRRDARRLAREFDALESSLVASIACSCAHNADGTTTPILCPIHADIDPCRTMASVTDRRRRGTVRAGTCTNCGWSA